MSKGKLIPRQEPLADIERRMFQKFLKAEVFYLDCVCMLIEMAEAHNKPDASDASIMTCFTHHLSQLLLKYPEFEKLLWAINAKLPTILHQSGEPLSAMLVGMLNQLVKFAAEQPIAQGAPKELLRVQNLWYVQSALLLDIEFRESNGILSVARKPEILADGEYCFILSHTEGSTLESASLYAMPVTKGKHKQVARGATHVWAAGEVTFQRGEVTTWNLQSGTYNKREGWANIEYLPFPRDRCETMCWLNMPNATQQKTDHHVPQSALRTVASTGSLTHFFAASSKSARLDHLVDNNNLSPRTAGKVVSHR